MNSTPFDLNKTVVDIAKQRAHHQGEQPHVTFLEDGDGRERTITFGQLNDDAARVAGWFQWQGLVPGDRVMMMLPNGIEFVQILYGCFYAGVIAVPQPQQLQAYIKTFLPTIRSARPKILVASTSIVDFVRKRLPSDLIEVFSELTVVTPAEILASETRLYDPPDIKTTDIAYLQYTSGSTGVPKGVMISHRNIIANMEQARIFGDWESGKGTALWLPLFHDFGLAAGLLGAMFNGGRVILMTPTQFMVRPIRWLNAITRYRCAYSYAPPFGYDLCIRQISEAEKAELDFSSLVSTVYGAEPVHYNSVKRFNAAFAGCGLSPTAVRPGFGMAETVIMFSESDRLRALCADREILETEGRLVLIDESAPPDRIKWLVNLGPAMHGHEMVIRDERSRALPEGRVGEIMLQGPSVAEGYFENPEETEKTFRQQIEGKSGFFLATGDLGLLWEGCLYFAGRIKDIIILRGRNYYPQDIAHTIPLGREIRPESVLAFAYADSGSGEKLAVAMEIEPELLTDLEMFHKYMLPTIDKRIVNELGQQLQIYPDLRLYLRPGVLTKTSSGKIKHHENREKLIQHDVNGLIARMPQPKTPDEDPLDLAVTVKALYAKTTGLEPDLNRPVYPGGANHTEVERFLAALQEQYPLPGLDIRDFVDSKTSLQALIDWLDDQLLSGDIPI